MDKIKQWEERLPLCPSQEEMISMMGLEIAELRAALADRATQADNMREALDELVGVIDMEIIQGSGDKQRVESATSKAMRLLIKTHHTTRAIPAQPVLGESEQVNILRNALYLMLQQFTVTPSTLADSEARCTAHAALKATAIKSIPSPSSVSAAILALPLPKSDWILAGSANNRDAYTADQMRDLLATAASLAASAQALVAQALVPKDYKLVPIEPTEAMIHAAEDVETPRPFGKVYRSMIEAAPTPPVIAHSADKESGND